MEFNKELEALKNRVLKPEASNEDKATYSEAVFESIKHINENGQEFWYGRELQKVLGYTEFNKMIPVIKKAMLACEKSGNEVTNHFAHVSEMVQIGSGVSREFDGYELSRYACYLIVMNADARKEIIALGQTYFAIKTIQQELIDDYGNLNENQKRLAIRNEMKIHNKSLAEAAQMAGVIEPLEYAIFQNNRSFIISRGTLIR